MNHNHKAIDKIQQITFVQASPQLLRLLYLSWSLSRRRTIAMLLGNVFESLLPAYDLSLRADLIEIINDAVRRKTFQGRRVARLLLLQLLSLILRNVVNILTTSNQQIINLRVSRILKRQLLDVHLKLDVVALETPEVQRILGEAEAMTNPGYVSVLISTVFNMTNSVTDIVARIAATSRNINIEAIPYFLAYSVVPLANIVYGRKRFSYESDIEPHILRKQDLSSIAFDTKSRREVSLLNLQDYLATEYTKVENIVEDIQKSKTADNRIAMRSLNIFTSFMNSAIYALLAYRSRDSNITLADLHLIENTTSGLITAGDRAIATQSMTTQNLARLIDYYSALKLKPALQEPSPPVLLQESCMTIEFKNVSFRYSDDQPFVLNDVSFKIKSGSLVALVGYNGSGKSTIISLLARVYDVTEGEVLINDINIKEYSRANLAEHMAFTLQDFARWPLTGRENVAVGRIDLLHSTDKIEGAARAAGAYDTLDSGNLWDKRLSKLTSEMQAAQAAARVESSRFRRHRPTAASTAGAELSGGQWQKVALSRSFLREGGLLVLDEPSANLDPQAEHDLFSNLVRTRSGRTTLFITHRLGLVKASDLIIFLDKGCVVELGTPEALMSLEGGRYRKLVEIQAAGYK